jgi:REP element-mobilizing transposase RayT
LEEIGGIEDHLHLLVNVPPSKSVSNCIRDIKANASRWMNELPAIKTKFEWQKGYAAFTVSHSQKEVVRRYIQNQREHHRKRSFEEEFIELLRRHEIPFERKYLFEDEHFA